MGDNYLLIIIGVAFITILASMVSELKSDINEPNSRENCKTSWSDWNGN